MTLNRKAAFGSPFFCLKLMRNAQRVLFVCEIILKITKKGKKKEGNTVYQVPFKMSGAKISVKDMDLTKAKKVE